MTLKDKTITHRYHDLYGHSDVEPNLYNTPHKGYKHSMKTYVLITLLITGVMSALWFVMGRHGGGGTTPPSFALGPSDMYFHSIGIGIASLIVYFVIMAFEIDKYEPNIDFPIAYRAMAATVIGAVSGLFYLFPSFNANTSPLSDIIMVVALL